MSGVSHGEWYRVEPARLPLRPLFRRQLRENAGHDVRGRGAIGAVLNQFDTNFTLEGTAIAAQVSSVQVNAFAISRPTQEPLPFVLTIEASKIYALCT